MTHSMSERYVKEILDKLEEIEKLHSKLRSLVPRAKNDKTEDESNSSLKHSTNMEDKYYVANENKIIDSPEQKPIDSRNDSESFRNTIRYSTAKAKKMFDPNSGHMKYLKKLKNRSSDEFKRLRSNSVNYCKKQWQDKNEKILDFLSPMYEPDIILVTRASQTTDGQVNLIAEAFQRKASTIEDISKRLSQPFYNTRNSNRRNKSNMLIQGQGLGNVEPHRVRKTLFIPDEKAETLKVISSARRISVTKNGKLSSSGNGTRNKLSGKITDILLE